MKQRELIIQTARRKNIEDIMAFGSKYTILSEYWQSLREGEGLEIERIRDFEIDDDADSVDLEDPSYLGRSSIVYRALEGVTTMIFADVSPSLMWYPEHPEYSKALIRDIAVAILINSAYENMTPVGLVLFSDRVERVFIPQSGQYARYILDQFLTYEIQERRGTSFECVVPYLTEFHDSINVIVSDFQDEKLHDSPFWRFGAGELDIIPIIVRDPLEKIRMMGAESFLCRDPEKGRDVSVHMTGKRWKEIERASRRFYGGLNQKFRELSMGYIMLDSVDVDLCHERLQQFFRVRSQGVYSKPA